MVVIDIADWLCSRQAAYSRPGHGHDPISNPHGYMITETPNRIAELRKAKGMTQQQLADAVGAHWITISKLERGKIGLTYEWAERLGKVLGVGEFGVYKDKLSRRNIFLSGFVQKGGESFYYTTEDNKEYEHPVDLEIDFFGKAATNWFVIEDDAGFPFFHTGDIIQVTWQNTADIEEGLNRLCLVAVKNSRPMMLGFLSRGKKLHTYDLTVLGGSVHKNIEITQVGLVTMAIFNAVVFDQGGPVAPDYSQKK